MNKRILIVIGAIATITTASSALANFAFINKTGDNILIQPSKYSKYCSKHEPIPKKGYFISLGQESSNNTSIIMTGKGNPGRTCTQDFNIY
jgi:hypothetical protein